MVIWFLFLIRLCVATPFIILSANLSAGQLYLATVPSLAILGFFLGLCYSRYATLYLDAIAATMLSISCMTLMGLIVFTDQSPTAALYRFMFLGASTAVATVAGISFGQRFWISICVSLSFGASYAIVHYFAPPIFGIERTYAAALQIFTLILVAFAYLQELAARDRFYDRYRLEDALSRNMQNLVETRNIAEKALRAKGEFLANMSHEIRTPMTGIIGMVSLARDQTADLEIKRMLDTVLRANSDLMVIVNSILDLAKVEAGELSLDKKAFDLIAMVRDVEELFKVPLRRGKVQLEVDIAEDVPAWVTGDGGRIRQVLNNLIGNAVKFTPEGSIQVRLSASQIDEHSVILRFDVRDTGIGIAADEVTNLFQRYVQAASAGDARFGGTGLGLAISRDLVVRMGGEIGVSSEQQVGSHFWFTVPVEYAAPELVGVEVAAKNQPAIPAGALRKLYVLLADDDEVSQIFLKALLEKNGHRIDLAHDGHQAVSMALDKPYDVLLMDVQMPGLDGVAATKLLRGSGGANAAVPIIGITANALPKDADLYRMAGMQDVVTKPFDSKILLDKIAHFARAPELARTA